MIYKHKLKKAIIDALNESFDIKDMDNDVRTPKSAKKKIEKQSKLYGRMKRVVDDVMEGGHMFTEMLTADDLNFLVQVKIDIDSMPDDVMELVNIPQMRDVVDNSIDMRMKLMVDKVDADDPFDMDDKYFIQNFLQRIHTKEDPLYACYDASRRSDNGTFRDFIAYYLHGFEKLFNCEGCAVEANLNWIDVSEVTSFKYLFSNTDEHGDSIDYEEYFDVLEMFDGDISLWETGEVHNMFGMFNQSNFDGDISRWDVSACRNMSYTFNGSAFNGDISKWNVGGVRLMISTFDDSRFAQDISKWEPARECDAASEFGPSMPDRFIPRCFKIR